MTLNYPPHQLHNPVLLQQVLAMLDPRKGETYLDLTAGYGGHARAILEKLGDAGAMTLVDRDSQAVSSLHALALAGARVWQSDFLSATGRLIEEHETFDLILLDLGVSSPQLDIKERGFSFAGDGPLDMRMDQSQELTAADIVNKWPEPKIAEIISEFGEEPHARAIAKAIVKFRPHKSTGALADVIAKTVRRRGTAKRRIHPATRTFQAIRITVNNELGQLERTLPLLPELLKLHGRLGIISFHSLEDRVVKKFLADESGGGYESRLELLTNKGPISGSEYDVNNPRARSAKLRAAAKIKM